MTRYFTKVADELLPVLRSGDNMPRGLRLLAEVERAGPGYTLVEFEDDDAPANLEGAEVTPTISVEYDKRGHVAHRWVSGRLVA